MQEEIWRDIQDFEGIYQVSNLGRVKSLERQEICGGRAKQRIRRERILKQGLDKYGYPSVVLCKDSKLYSRKVHRLVLSTFTPILFPMSINHKDGNKQNNHLSNLEWVTTKQNAIHAQLTGLCPSGERHYKAKLSYRDVAFIKASTKTLTQLATQFHVNICTINDIVKGRSWKHLTLSSS